MRKEELIGNAMAVMKNSYSPYSGFCVGAALLCKDGKVFTGCNVENSSFSVTNCAERSALFAAVSHGKKEFTAMAIVGGKNGRVENYCPPCGVCRQALSKFCKKGFKIYLYNGSEIKSYTLEELLPMSFELGQR